jgi:hypothetical protein
MANKKNTSGSWKKERASTKTKGSAKGKSNKYRPVPADTSKRPAPGSGTRYWRAGYTRKDGTQVQGHYVNKSS